MADEDDTDTIERTPDVLPPPSVPAPPAGTAPDDERYALDPNAARGMGGASSDGFGDLAKEYKERQAKIGELYKKRSEALAPRYDAMQKALEREGSDPGMEPPIMKRQPPVPKQTQGELLQTVGPYLGILGAMVAAGFGGRHATSSLAAVNGMFEGANRGAKEVVEEQQKIWEMESKAVTEENKEKLEAYKLAYQKYRGDFARQMEALKIEAARFDDEIAYQIATQQDSVKFGEHMMKLQTATQQYEKARLGIENMIERGKLQQEQGANRLSREQIKLQEEQLKLERAKSGAGEKASTFSQPQGMRDYAQELIANAAPRYANDPGLLAAVEDYLVRLRSTGATPPPGGVQKVINDYLAAQRKSSGAINRQMQDQPAGWFSGAKKGAGRDPKNPIIINSNEELQALPHGKGTIYYKWFDEDTVYKID